MNLPDLTLEAPAARRATPLSVVIPTLNADRHLPSCLNALMPGLPCGLIREVIIVDGGSGDATLTQAAAAGCRIVSSSKGRGRQLQAGAKIARSDWLLFLHADTQLAPEWPGLVHTHIQSAPECAAAFRLAFDSHRLIARLAESLVALRILCLALPYGDQGLLISRLLYDELGGYNDVPILEDLELVMKLGRQRLKSLPGPALTSAEKYEQHGWLRQSSGNLLLLARCLSGTPTEKLVRSRS